MGNMAVVKRLFLLLVVLISVATYVVEGADIDAVAAKHPKSKRKLKGGVGTKGTVGVLRGSSDNQSTIRKLDKITNIFDHEQVETGTIKEIGRAHV